MLAEDNEHPSEYVLRYLKTLAAWDYTISQTTRLEIFCPDMVPRLFITDTPRPQNMVMASISDLVHELKPRLITDYYDATYWRILLDTSIRQRSSLEAPFIANPR